MVDERDSEHAVTPLELFFDLVFVFAFTQVTSLLVDDPTSGGMHRLALDAYSYLHLPIVAGIVIFALGLETTLHAVGEPLDTVPAAALCGGAALYLLGEIAFLLRTMGRVFRRRTIAAVVLLALIPAATALPALASLALVGAVCSLLVAYEAIGRREYRVRLRHPEPAD